MKTALETTRITLYVGIACAIAWAVGLVIYLTGGLVNSPAIITFPGGQITLALILMATIYMWSPALAHILTRLITREGRQGLWLQPHLRQGWRYWLATWFVPALATLLGAIAFFVLFPSYFDPSLTTFSQLLKQAEQRGGQAIPFSPWVLLIIQLGSAIMIAPLFNSLFTFGDEFGWRAYLLPKLLPLGENKALLLTGVIWGIWHWPVIAMGHNYGTTYPGAPWTGILAMIWFTVVTGIFLGWSTLRAGSVWPAVIGHAAINGISSAAALFTTGNPNPLLGPLPIGLIGSLGWTVLAIWLMWRRPSAAALPT